MRWRQSGFKDSTGSVMTDRSGPDIHSFYLGHRQPQFGYLEQSASLVGIEGQPLPSGKEDTAHGSLNTLGSHEGQEG